MGCKLTCDLGGQRSKLTEKTTWDPSQRLLKAARVLPLTSVGIKSRSQTKRQRKQNQKEHTTRKKKLDEKKTEQMVFGVHNALINGHVCVFASDRHYYLK